MEDIVHDTVHEIVLRILKNKSTIAGMTLQDKYCLFSRSPGGSIVFDGGCAVVRCRVLILSSDGFNSRAGFDSASGVSEETEGLVVEAAVAMWDTAEVISEVPDEAVGFDSVSITPFRRSATSCDSGR